LTTPLEIDIPPTLPDSRSVYKIPERMTLTEYLRVFTVYINSGLHPADYLEWIKYPNPENKKLQMRLHADLRERMDNLQTPPQILIDTCKSKRGQPPPIREVQPLFTDIINPTTSLPALIGGEVAVHQTLLSASTDLTVDPSMSPTEQIKLWRAKQSYDDYSSAQQLRRQVLALIPMINPHDFRASDIRSIAATLLDIQKIQRMAIGLSSENVGFKMEGLDSEGADLPVINVLSKAMRAAVVDAESSPSESESESGSDSGGSDGA
jgi:hypothetical protein